MKFGLWDPSVNHHTELILSQHVGKEELLRRHRFFLGGGGYEGDCEGQSPRNGPHLLFAPESGVAKETQQEMRVGIISNLTGQGGGTIQQGN